ncbi:isoprenylcysteine carboxylmethyltransferase family protein [Aliiroseovarius sp. S2029]|uniref:methyltransferase family protein n=1 Tax=Aliiroseovarius sp. S2029 TaxID=2936988 RepID=UPI0020BEF3C4|nr:isoprenylcysteine carboxylmethyltransferase family protein [Aliiroseovarius sp. S2029]MCK8483887.1 isoprenylcysteine carboxylmethyltransferase family protein [Aliiroseovarius sp. S2029]
MSRHLRWIDMPPVWLALMVALAYGLDRIAPGLGFGFEVTRGLGNLLIVLGLCLLGVAIWEFMRARTTVIPGQQPTALLTRGIYRWTRNPIYLGDAMILTGLILRWDVLPALLLVPVFTTIITKRFILWEEAALRAKFGPAFDDWAGQVRRWI